MHANLTSAMFNCNENVSVSALYAVFFTCTLSSECWKLSENVTSARRVDPS